MNNRERIFPDIVDSFFFLKAWEIFLENREFILKLVVIVAVFSTALATAFNFAFEDRLNTEFSADTEGSMKSFIALMFFQLLLQVVVSLPETLILIVYIAAQPRMYERQEVTVNNSFTVNTSKWVILYVYTVFVLLLQVVGLTMCIVPGLIIMIQFALMPLVIVLEDDVSVIPRSMRVVSGRQWNVLMIYFGYFSLTLIMMFVSLAFSTGNGGEAAEAEAYTITFASLAGTFISNLILTAAHFFMLILFFQLYMISRIEHGEIEIVEDAE